MRYKLGIYLALLCAVIMIWGGVVEGDDSSSSSEENSERIRQLTDSVKQRAAAVSDSISRAATNAREGMSNLLNRAATKIRPGASRRKRFVQMQDFPQFNQLMDESEKQDFNPAAVMIDTEVNSDNATDTSVFDYPGGSFVGIFGDQWFTGPNVCVTKQEVDEPSDIPLGNMGWNMQTFSCGDTERAFTCTTKIRTAGFKKTSIMSYHCCQGYRRDRSAGCIESEERPMSDVIKNVGGGEFLSLVQSMMLEERLMESNLTVFCPITINTRTTNNEFENENSIDLNRPIKKRRVQTDSYRTKERNFPTYQETSGLVENSRDQILNHLVANEIHLGDVIDEQVLYSQSENDLANQLRINVFYVPHKVVTVNCVKVKSANNYAVNGLVHTVEKLVPQASQTVADIIARTPELSHLYRILLETEIWSKLDSTEMDSGLTIFAPSNSAFNKLNSTTRRMINTNAGGCSNSLWQHHVIPHTLCSCAVGGIAQASSMLDTTLTIRRDADNKMFVNGNNNQEKGNGAQIVSKDIMATNGVVHIIDDVLLTDQIKSLEVILKENQLTEFLGLLTITNIYDSLDQGQNLTIFAPTDQAIKEFRSNTDDVIPKQIKDIVRYHVVETKMDYCDMAELGTLKTSFDNKPLRIDTFSEQAQRIMLFMPIPANQFTVQCAKIEKKLTTCGNAIYVIDKVLIPPAGSIIDVLASEKSLSIMRRIVRESNMESILDQNGEDGQYYTLLAPSDESFYEFGEEKLQELINSQSKCMQFVQAHLIEGQQCCSSVPRSIFADILNEQGFDHGLTRDSSGKVRMGHSNVIRCDIQATNGIVHILDKAVAKNKRKQSRLFAKPFTNWPYFQSK